MHAAHPNLGHQILAKLENHFDVHIITQNIDDLHERAGSTKVLHLHVELLKVRSLHPHYLIMNWETDLYLGNIDLNGNQLCPNIVWFGEEGPALEVAVTLVEKADILIIIGTSLQVYPAAGLMNYANPSIPVYYIDPKPATMYDLQNRVEIIPMNATKGVAILQRRLFNLI